MLFCKNHASVIKNNKFHANNCVLRATVWATFRLKN
jgi:hypothetical protein